MVCGRCGVIDENGEFSRIGFFEGPEPTKGELIELLQGPGLKLCPDCQSEYLNFLMGDSDKEWDENTRKREVAEP